ncbi:DUF928 domain-containing protein [Limnofasciculus baicalensis]|uniref:DUF928 domain-containing protein n=1 Tax=Limnofasciculus baicalensis BBK-W-15 TaxID=2699891 RepID=A0AAE3GQS2_9CYAN|nr:DUF928 domain-containing protein [Limnofasciculus baicalensis]MCP2728484.1 DUF928 domain-containing protein [Limnofasciculus baicalensis BBK-W-15]
MKRIYKLIMLALLSVSITFLGWGILVEAANPPIQFISPNIEPPQRIGSSYMLHGGPSCPNYYTHALIPANQLGLTAKEAPILLFHVDNRDRAISPETISLEIELHSADDKYDEELLYNSRISVPTVKLPAIIGFRIPEIVYSQLKIDQFYQWSMAINCGKNTGDISHDSDYIGGFIYPTQLDAKLAAEIAKAKPIEQVAIYAANGIWYQALDILTQLRKSDSNNQKLAGDWESLLKSAGFDTRYDIKLDRLVRAKLWL